MKLLPRKVIGIFGMPRSGTSFVGQIFDGHPRVAFRMEPLFAYQLKNVVDEHSSRSEYVDFLNQAFRATDSRFMNQLDKRENGSYPTFVKQEPDVLVFKTTRFHHLIPVFLQHFADGLLKIVVVVRNPCGAISSWLSHPGEFPPDLDPLEHWKTGQCRKTAVEEYWGFDDWMAVTTRHLQLERDSRFLKVFSYEDLVADPLQGTRELFRFAGLTMHEQVAAFVEACHATHHEDPYSVFRSKQVVHAWKQRLDPRIIAEIRTALAATDLARFLEK